MKIQIKNTSSLEILFETEADSIGLAVKAALEANADLRYADLRYANLSHADLRYANLSEANLSYAELSDANLSYADLSEADLSHANLGYANLSHADLREANLREANFREANLRYADLSEADLSHADLSHADLREANLREANLSKIKKDMFEKMALMPNEVSYLYKSVMDGKINGSAYEGECACFCGTLANAINSDYRKIPVNPNSYSPTERFFLGINAGDNPDNNQISKTVSKWIEEFCKENDIKLPARRIVWDSK